MHYWTVVYGDIPDELQPVVEWNRHKFGLEVVRLGPIVGAEGVDLVETITIASDTYRWRRLASQADGADEIYVDPDCMLLKPLDDITPEALPYWPLDNPAATPQPDAFVTRVSRELAQAVLGAGEKTCGLNQYCWPRKVLRDWPGIKQIDPSYYEHLMYSTNKRRQLQRAAKAATILNPEE